MDDVDGIPNEHPGLPPATNLTDAEIAEIRFATQTTGQRLVVALVAAGKYSWQALGANDFTIEGPIAGECTAWMRQYCDYAYQGRPLLMQFNTNSANQSVAAFLIVRPPNAYLGWGWYSDDSNWRDEFLLQAGEPTGQCVEMSSGVFSRAWTMGTPVLDCNTWTATLPFRTIGDVALHPLQ